MLKFLGITLLAGITLIACEPKESPEWPPAPKATSTTTIAPTPPPAPEADIAPASPEGDPLACIPPECIPTHYWDGESLTPLEVPASPPAGQSDIVLQEDDPGWSCSTNGNGICGPTTVNLLEGTVIAANGTFPYDRLEVLEGVDGTYYCAYGTSPNRGIPDTALTCTQTAIA